MRVPVSSANVKVKLSLRLFIGKALKVYGRVEIHLH